VMIPGGCQIDKDLKVDPKENVIDFS